MKRQKWQLLAVLGGAAGLLGLALLLLSHFGREEGDSTILLCPIGNGTVQTITYQQGETDVTLQRGADDTWTLADDPALPLDQSAVQTMLEKMCALQATRDLGTAAEGSADFGLDAPYATVRLEGGGESFTLTVGALNSVTNTYYAQVAGKENFYLVNSADISGLCLSRRGLYAAQSVTELTAQDVRTMTVQHGADADGALRFAYDGETWTLADDPAYALDQDAVTRLANTVCNLQTTWTITAPGPDADYGLELPDVTVTVAGEDGKGVTCRFGAAIPGRDETDAGSCYLAADTAPGVVYETEVEQRDAFACTKESLAAADTAAETNSAAAAP